MGLKLTQVATGVHRLENVYTNWYLLEEGGRLTLLDAGLPGDWRDFCSCLTRLGHTPADVDAVLITHHHADHRGNAERLRSSGARVFAHPSDAPDLRGDKRSSNSGLARFLWRPWYLFYMFSYVAKGITRTPAVAELNQLADGEILDVPGSPRVVHAPGHTPGSCALVLEERSVLFSGDALVHSMLSAAHVAAKGHRSFGALSPRTLTWRWNPSARSPERTRRWSYRVTANRGRTV